MEFQSRLKSPINMVCWLMRLFLPKTSCLTEEGHSLATPDAYPWALFNRLGLCCSIPSLVSVPVGCSPHIPQSAPAS